MELIDKAAVVAEIEGRLSLLEGSTGHPEVVKRVEGAIKAYKGILSFLDTLEVKEEFKLGESQIYLEDDGGEPPYDGKQWLDLSCKEYEIPNDKFKDGDNIEIVIRKIKKGE